MKRKLKIVSVTYLLAAVTAFSVYLGQGINNLRVYRRAAEFTALKAFEETAFAVDSMRASLEKSIYSSQGPMSARLCGEIYASALAAETAMASLPFSTGELEKLSAFLNFTGDYAYSICTQAAKEGFTARQREKLEELSEAAGDFSAFLYETRGGINAGSIIMDSGERSLKNISSDVENTSLSSGMLAYEKSRKPMEETVYEGKYCRRNEKSPGKPLTDREAGAMAAEFAGVQPESLRKNWDYEGTAGRSCWSAGDLSICLSPAGVETMQSERLVEQQRLSTQEAEAAAMEFLRQRGYENLLLTEGSRVGCVYSMVFSEAYEGALRQDNYIRIAIAMDDGSVHSFSAVNYCPEPPELQWLISREEAEKLLPEGLEPDYGRKVIRKSPSGRELPCWELGCRDKKGRGVRIYLDGETGMEFDIVPERKNPQET